ncbi:hypothetical protein FALBO_3734 [Fusarium albosuccineum]|uniref:Uncharacterized protein n=1 Tax=Fusarium albosuccineum TaxID=1237068 RepID=A0A8H4PL29_9HYPO|nr:hypothetical protein FALBO_3734 [Fusarium albosuccineum]
MVATRETPIPRTILVFNQVEQDVAQWGQKLAGIQSPAQKYEQEMMAVRAKLDAAWDRIFQTRDLSERSQLQAEIQAHAGEQQRLESNYESGLADAEAEYERQVNTAVKACFEKLSESIHMVLGQDVSNHPQDTNQQPQAGHGEELPETAQNRTTRKRKRSLGALDQQEPLRPTTRQGRKIVNKTIQFDSVFQNGNAPIKHVIVQYPLQHGSWYILRCEEHGLSFKDNPLIGAAAHIRSKKHSETCSDFERVVTLLGVEVLGCNESLAKKNNIAARKAFKSGYGYTTAESNQVSEDIVSSQDRGRTRDHRGQREASQVIDPEHGQIYRVYWKSSKQWLAALLLPMHNLQDVGIPNSIEGLGLLEDLPKCYAYDPRRKNFSWEEGYEDDGPRVLMRKFPVMFFDGSPFPSKSTVAWVSAGDLEIYDASAQSLTEHNQQVLEYLEARERAGRARTRDSSADIDISESLPSAPRNQEVPVNSQSDTTAIRPSAPLPVTVSGGEVSLRHAAPQTNDDTSSLPGHPDQSPRDPNRRVTTTLASNELGGEPPSASTASLSTQISQPNHQTQVGTTEGTTPAELEAMAQMAWDVATQPLSTITEGAPMNQVQDSREKLPLARPQDPATSQNAPSDHPEHISTSIAGQRPQNEDVFQISTNTDPRSVNPACLATMVTPQQSFGTHEWSRTRVLLPPIRPREEDTPPPRLAYYGPNRASVSSIDGTRQWMGSAVDTQRLQSQNKDLQTSTPGMTPDPNFPVWQAPIVAVPSRNSTWLSGFPPSVSDHLRRMIGSTSRDPQPNDFINSEGDFRCPFCAKDVAQLRFFNAHLKQRCRVVRSTIQPATMGILKPKLPDI